MEVKRGGQKRYRGHDFERERRLEVRKGGWKLEKEAGN
jgi:hypothetical protein